MEVFKTIEGILDDELHPKYKNLLNPEFKNHRDIIQGWVEGFVDRDNKIVKEFQTTYHSSLWEFYLYALFKELGFELNQESEKNRPDFIITKPFEMYVEAVISNIKETGIPESKRSMEDIMSMFIPPYEQKDFYKNLDEAIIRQSKSIMKKKDKYKKNYSKCKLVHNDKPYIIALSSYDQINYGREYIYPMMALLYGKYYNAEKEIYEMKKSVTKQETNSNIPIGIFNNEEYSNVSAIIYIGTLSIGKITSLSISRGDYSQNKVYSLYKDYEKVHPYKLKKVSPKNPEHLLDGIFIFHNPNAKIKLPFECFANEHITQITVNDKGKIEHTNIPNLIVRTDFPKLLKKGFNMIIQEYVRHYNKCGVREFYNNIDNDEVDFSNDCCVYIVGANAKADKKNHPVIRCKYERPQVMPNEMLKYEAEKVIDGLIEDKIIVSSPKPKIIIVRDNIRYNVVEKCLSNPESINLIFTM